MKFIRKALLPAMIAAGFLGFLGTVGTDVPAVSAFPGDICAIDGPTSIAVGETVLYTIRIEDDDEDNVWAVDIDDHSGDSDITSRAEPSDDYETINNTDAISDLETEDLVPAFIGDDTWDPDFIDALEALWGIDVLDDDCGETPAEGLAGVVAANKAAILADLKEAVDDGEVCGANPLPGFNNVPVQDGDDADGGEPICTLAEFSFEAGDGECFPNPGGGGDDCNDNTALATDSYGDQDIDCGLVTLQFPLPFSIGGPCAEPTPAMIDAVATFLANYIAANETFSCALDGLPAAAENAAFNITGNEFIAGQVQDFLFDDYCDDLDGLRTNEGIDEVGFFDVTCYEAGEFEISVHDVFEADNAMSIEVVCGGDVETATITARPTSVETNPSLGNVAHSLVWVQLFDDQDEPSFPGTKVIWMTDRCAIETSAVNDETEFEAAESLFGAAPNNTALNPALAAAIESSVYATTGPDGASRQQDEDNSFTVTGAASTDFAMRTVSAAILHCDPIHAPSVAPGPAVVTAIIVRGQLNNGQVADNDDLVLKTTVTVVGPPAANGVTLTAAPATLACGEKATLTATVKDAIGQNVSDHTLVEAVTNAGGVLAGTGAVAGQAGLVSPVSSTVMETYGGQATFYLLTSTAHVGAYEVVITTGGGGGVTGQLANGGVTTNLLGGLFSTQPISVQVTVNCTVAAVTIPVPAPTTTGPRTGQGITPPSTGDAGLVSTESNWVVGAVAAVVAAIVVAGFSVKLVRDEN